MVGTRRYYIVWEEAVVVVVVVIVVLENRQKTCISIIVTLSLNTHERRRDGTRRDAVRYKNECDR